jgi:GH18 family chitinase
VGRAHAAGVRVMISIGGGDQSGALAPLLGADQADAFVAALLDYVLAHELDGVDVDVEGSVPGTADYAPFVLKLGAALHARHRLISAALATWVANDVADGALESFDFINVMAYDHCGAWTDACEQSTYDAAVADLATFSGRVAADRLVLGVPFYAWCWGNCSADALSYAELLAAYPDAPAQDWIERDGAQLSYNGTATLMRKVELARAHGGVMIWELGHDAPGEASLLRAIVSQLRAP